MSYPPLSRQLTPKEVVALGHYIDEKGVRCAAVQLSLPEMQGLHWIPLSTVLGVGQTGLRKTLFDTLARDLKKIQPLSETYTLFEKLEAVLIENNKKGAWQCIIDATDFTRENGEFYRAVFRKGNYMWLASSDFKVPPKVPTKHSKNSPKRNK